MKSPKRVNGFHPFGGLLFQAIYTIIPANLVSSFIVNVQPGLSLMQFDWVLVNK